MNLKGRDYLVVLFPFAKNTIDIMRENLNNNILEVLFMNKVAKYALVCLTGYLIGLCEGKLMNNAKIVKVYHIKGESV